MSVIKAILFYSKRHKKSLQMKKIINNIGIDIESISVDAIEIRNRLLDDEKFGINKVPSVLVLYSSGLHKKYTGSNLDQWFDQLLQNIKKYQQQQQSDIEQPAPIQQPINENVPKSLRRKPSNVVDIPTSLPSPGKRLLGSETPTAAQAAMIQEHIRQPELSVTSDPLVQPSRKEVKTECVSAVELAKKMNEQREQLDEKIEENRPFI